MLKTIVAAALAAGAALAAATPAQAADGCGRDFHRGPYGHCRPNAGRGAVVGGPGVRLVIGNRYDRGYWDGHRYWRNRYRHHGGWRYR